MHRSSLCQTTPPGTCHVASASTDPRRLGGWRSVGAAPVRWRPGAGAGKEEPERERHAGRRDEIALCPGRCVGQLSHEATAEAIDRGAERIERIRRRHRLRRYDFERHKDAACDEPLPRCGPKAHGRYCLVEVRLQVLDC